jgi:hypothetical protein
MKAKQKRPSGLKAGSSANEKAAPNNGIASSLRGLTSLGSSKPKKDSENGIVSNDDGKVDAGEFSESLPRTRNQLLFSSCSLHLPFCFRFNFAYNRFCFRHGLLKM